MDILWLSIRKRDDLSSSTQQGILSVLTSHGHSVRFVGPASPIGQGFLDCEYIDLPQKNKWGRRTSSFAKEVKRWLDVEQPKCDAIFLDWPLYTYLRSRLTHLSAPKILIDRSPPASNGILSLLQWRHWKQAWKAASNGSFSAGCVVSASHSDFVTSRCGTPQCPIITIAAGVSTFSEQPRTLSQPLQLVYHGRLDANRGLSHIIEFAKKSRHLGVDVQLTLYGTGDYVQTLKNHQDEVVRYGGNIEQHRMHQELERFHFGLLPMPATKVWSIASPLKQNEYLAAGLPILGIDHAGHQIDHQGDFVQLYAQHDFSFSAIQFLEQLDEATYLQLSTGALEYAQHHCTWEHRCKGLLDALSSLQK